MRTREPDGTRRCSGASRSRRLASAKGSSACRAPARSMEENCARLVTPESHGLSQLSSGDDLSAVMSASSLTSGHCSPSMRRMRSTRACHSRSSFVHGRHAGPRSATACVTAESTLSAGRSRPRKGSSLSTRLPSSVLRRASTVSVRSSQRTTSSSRRRSPCSSSSVFLSRGAAR